MKFWQITTILRDESKLLVDIFFSHSRLDFYDSFKNLEFLVLTQRRDMLDIVLPESLVLDALSKSKLKFYLDLNKRDIYTYKNSDSIKEISAIDLYQVIGADQLEELMEKTNITIKKQFPL